MFAIIVTAIVTVYLAFKIRTKLIQRKVNRLARDLFGDVKTSLATNPNGLTETEILRRYLAYPQHKDALSRDE